MRDFFTVFAKRYIAGTGKIDAIAVAKELNLRGIMATIDNLGENVKDLKEADAAVDEYMGLLEEVKVSGVLSTVSLKLTHLGLDISEQAAEHNAERIIKKAYELDNFVCIDMEGSPYTQRAIDIFLKLRAGYPNVGIAIQSYLLRSTADIKLLIKKDASVRLVKGAYKEPPEIAYGDKKDVDMNFETLMKELLLHGNRPAIATHDEKLIDSAIKFAAENNIPRERFEFQMLLGIKRTLQKKLADSGFKIRVYVPYGPEWFSYILRRFRERKENLLFVIKNLFD